MSEPTYCEKCPALIPNADHPCARCALTDALEAPNQDESGTRFLEDLPLPPEESELNGAPTHSVDPTVAIGRYKLIEKLGEGGFGEVWMAEQNEPVRRRVALKVIKLGMDTRQVVARFEAERQALAMMDHPHIAKVHDGGIASFGRPYFVMELVTGVPLTDFCDTRQLCTRERLRLFIKVCQAVQHAHQKGVIHRDIKPTNILVSLHDGEPVPKVIDFGIAKATQAELTEKTIVTQLHQLMGTPAYMSPEQVTLSGWDIDTRSDIYSLGVVLYELLTGQTPFDSRELLKAGVDELRHIMRETEPFRPSVKLAGLNVDELTDTARKRATDAGKLPHLVRGDLDWIVMKCLEKSRNRRYETANGLAMDLRRYLDEEPVSARPPGTLYRLSKMVRRHKTAAIVTTGIAVALLLGTTVSTWLAVRAIRAEEEQRTLRLEEITLRQQAQADKKRAEALRTEARSQAYVADIGVAYASYNELSFTRAQQVLAAYDQPLTDGVDHRGIEWYLLRQLCRGDQVKLLGDQRAPAMAVTYTPDGRQLASGSLDGQIRIYDTRLWSLTTNWPAHSGGVVSLSFSRDGKLLASAGRDGYARIWDLHLGKVSWMVALPIGVAVRFSPQHDLLAISSALDEWGSSLGTVSLHDAESGQKLASWPGGRCAFSSDGDWFAQGPLPGNGIRVCKFGSPTNVVVDMIAGAYAIVDLGIATRAGRQMVSWLTYDGTLQSRSRSLASRTWSPEKTINIGSQARAMLLSEAITAYSRQEGIITFQVRDGPHVINSTLLGHGKMLRSFALHPNELQLATASDDCTVRIWDLAGDVKAPHNREPQLSGVIIQHEGPAPVMAPDGSRMWCRQSDGSIVMWCPQHQHPPVTLPIKGEPLAYLPKQRLLLFREVSKTDNLNFGPLRLCTPEGQSLGTFDASISHPSQGGSLEEKLSLAFKDIGNLGSISSTALSVDGERLAFGLWEGSVLLIDVDSWRRASAPAELRYVIQSLTFSPDGKYLAVTTREPDVATHVYNAKTLAPIISLNGHTRRVKATAFSPDGSRLATASFDSQVKVWDTSSWTQTSSFDGHQNAVLAVAFSSDGRTIGSLGDDGRLHLWSVTTGREFMKFNSTGGFAQFVAFLPNKAGLIYSDAPNAIRTLLTDLAAPPSRCVSELLARSNSTNRISPDSLLPFWPSESAQWPVKLDRWYNAALDQPWHNRNDLGNDLAALTPGIHSFEGTLFKVGGIAQLQSGELKKLSPQYPEKIMSIPLERTSKILHFLQGTGWPNVSDGTIIGCYRIHYQDGQVTKIPIRYGTDVRNWQFWPEGLKTESMGAQPVWKGPQERWQESWPNWGVRLYRQTWVNPRPAVKILTLDFESTMSASAPFLLSISGE